MTKTIDIAEKTRADESAQMLSEAELAVVVGGRPDLQSIPIMKPADASSPNLFL
jgi:hypothetical protein